MAGKISMGARREVVSAVTERYRSAKRGEKGRILDELCATTDWHRKHAVRALRRRETVGSGKLETTRKRKRRYGATITRPCCLPLSRATERSLSYFLGWRPVDDLTAAKSGASVDESCCQRLSASPYLESHRALLQVMAASCSTCRHRVLPDKLRNLGLRSISLPRCMPAVFWLLLAGRSYTMIPMVMSDGSRNAREGLHP